MVHDLNYLQCCLRKRPLTDEEKRTITSMITDGQVENRLKAGAYILLGDKDMAKIYIERLSEYERNEFCQYPIYRLLDHYDQYYKKTL